MTLEIPEAGTEIAGGRFPDQRCRNRIEAIIQLRCTDPERAQVIANHGNVVQFLRELSRGPNARSVGGSEEFVSHQSAVDAQPEWKITFHASRSWQRANAGAHTEPILKPVVKISRKHDLSWEPLRWV